MSAKKFQPKILALICKWCTSAGADLAGVSRQVYPSNILPITVNCTGRIDPLFIIRGLENGADGILVSGCHEGDCHYVDGNIKALKRFNFFKRILDEMGIGNRIIFEHISASEGVKWARVTKEFTETIRKLGPTPVKAGKKLTELYIDETYRKKHGIHDILVSIAKKLKYEPKEPIFFDADEIMEGYGFPKRDPEKCIGCYACYSICPEQVISVEDVEEKRKYGTLHASCVVCKECQKTCPQEAIEVLPGFEILSYLKKEPLWDIDIDLHECSICKELFSPVPFVNELRSRISAKNAQEALNSLQIPFDPFTTCPSCKREIFAKTIVGVAQPAIGTGEKT
ncbi:MAG: hydrogenase iron-sulfur subunit [Candidatus Hodarchaeales archaeon]|jgi:coenzyme F420-reducing hydrogenase delta subunit/NAD-dependent dihydropyrimidine dehydrogenase PreA subunit